MVKYQIYKNNKKIDVFGYEQYFSKEDIKNLWDEHKILYMQGGVMAVWVEERKNNNPLIHLMSEDDGHIFWSEETDVAFDSDWLNNYIGTLTKVKNLIKKQI